MSSKHDQKSLSICPPLEFCNNNGPIKLALVTICIWTFSIRETFCEMNLLHPVIYKVYLI